MQHQLSDSGSLAAPATGFWCARARNVKGLMLFAMIVAFLSSCAAMQESQGGAPKPKSPANELPDGDIRFDTSDPRIVELWAASEQARRNQNRDQALRHLFEAIEISPENSLLWSRAAEIQLSNEQAALAENFAAKSNTYAGNNNTLLHRNWLIIEHARSLRGDLLGVRSAHKKVQEYQYR